MKAFKSLLALGLLCAGMFLLLGLPAMLLLAGALILIDSMTD